MVESLEQGASPRAVLGPDGGGLNPLSLGGDAQH